VAVPGVQNKLEIVELPSLARWSLPGLLPLSGAIEVTPTGRRLAATAFEGYAVFDLPDPGSDLAAWIEVYIGGAWYIFDPRNNVARIGRVLIARGRDAADVAIATTFGPNTLESFQVWTDEVAEGNAAGSAMNSGINV